MPLRLGAFKLFDRLSARFGIEPEALPGVPSLYRTVIPVTDVDQVLTTPHVGQATVDVSSAAAVAGTVGTGKRWTLLIAYKGTTVGTTNLVISVGGELIGLFAPQTARETTFFEAVLDEGDFLQLQPSGNGADTAIDVRWHYTEIDYSG
tara:strand:- start:124 stop:570 length:447 start_codon:yes stop_codon:yes gene_type:complete